RPRRARASPAAYVSLGATHERGDDHARQLWRPQKEKSQWTRSLGRWPTRRPSRRLRPVNLAAWIETSASAFGPPPWRRKRNKPKSGARSAASRPAAAGRSSATREHESVVTTPRRHRWRTSARDSPSDC